MSLVEKLTSIKTRVNSLENAIDNSGVLDNTDGTITDKVNLLIEKAQNAGGDDFANSIIDKTIENLIFDGPKIGAYVFKNCSKLKEVKASNATSVGDDAFQDCTALVSIDFPVLVSVGGSAFSGCSKLINVNAPNITSISDSGFSGVAFESANFPKLTAVGRYAFGNNKQLKEVILPVVKTMSRGCFQNCTALTEITLPASITSMYADVFSGCTNLLNIYVPWAEGAIVNAPWGATNATIHYNYTAEV